MQKYAVALYNCYSGQNKVNIVYAENGYDAVMVAVQGTPEDFYPSFNKNVDQLLEHYADGDLMVSDPVLITED